MRTHRCGLIAGVLASLCFFAARPAGAVPLLQLYIEGATYDSATETWVYTPQGSSAGAPFRIWAIGNVAGPGGQGPISEVRMAIAYDKSKTDVVDLTLHLADEQFVGYFGQQGYAFPEGFELSEGRVDAELRQGPEDTAGTTPKLSDGRDLPWHGIYGDETVWQEFDLGDFSLTDSPIGDFIGDFPADLTASAGQINVYEVTVLNGHGTTLYFDLYNHVEAGNRGRAVFAPFSHNASIVPAPATLIGFIGLLPILVWRRVK